MKIKALLIFFVFTLLQSTSNAVQKPTITGLKIGGFPLPSISEILPESLYQYLNKPVGELLDYLKAQEYALIKSETEDDLTAKSGRKIKVHHFQYSKEGNEISITSRIPENGGSSELVSYIESLSVYDKSKMSSQEYERINITPHIKQLEQYGFKKTDRNEDYVFLKKGKPGSPGYIECQFSHGKKFNIEFSIED